MFKCLRNLFLSEEEKKILKQISKYKTMRVIGRGTLYVDPKEVTSTEQFKHYTKLVKELIKNK